MKQLLPLTVVLVSTFLLSCQKELLQKEQELNQEDFVLAAKANKEVARTFKGSYTTASQILQPAPLLQTRITGTGQVSHLGRSTFVALSTIDFTKQPPFLLGGTATFTAANGDEFYTTFTGTSTPTGQGTFNIVNTHIITGGTGRFENASGTFAGYTVAYPGHTEGYIEHEGTISY